jgi:hypothetical protein
MAQIERTGVINFNDASISIWEDGLNPRMSWEDRQDWNRKYKHEVFKRFIQALNRLGWTVKPQHYIFTSNDARFCQKGELKGDLQISGMSIDFKMFQSINCPTRPDHEGRHEWNKEACMPYVTRLEMERTRRRIRDYLCNVFTGYVFKNDKAPLHRKPLQRTAMECIEQRYAENWHFKGKDWDTYKTEAGMSYNLRSADGVSLEHGQRVWFADRKGRICEGTTYYNINNMWWVVTGRYDFTNVGVSHLYAKCPELPRIKRNAKLRRTRLEQELKTAVAAMNFHRAQTLKEILYPPGQLYAIWHKGHKAYLDIGYCGYRNNMADAGHYTFEELKPHLKGALEDDDYKAIPVGKQIDNPKATAVAESAVAA